MFLDIFKKNYGERKTGIYRLENDYNLIEFDTSPGNGSINSIIEELGFERSQIHVIFTFDSKKIEYIGVKIFTKHVAFVLTKETVVNLTLSILNQELNKVDWNYEYSSHNIEDILNVGIESKSLTLDFLKTVIELNKENDTLYLAPTLDLYLNFNNNILNGFASSEWSNAASKWLKNLNENMFDDMLSEASNYHESEFDAMLEVNIQCDSLQSIPAGIENEFISQHRKSNGNINFYNLFAAHYDNSISIQDFKHVNKGRFILKDEYHLEVDGFIYEFGSTGKLINAFKE